MRHEPRRLLHPDAAPGGTPEHPQAVGAKETVISLLIAFALAFVFRGYVVEPYVIPTNSMAPTLLGAHIRWVDGANGYDWPTTHFFGAGSATDPRGGPPMPHQGGVVNGVNFGPLVAYDPMTRQEVQIPAGQPIRSGDRIFVLRYLWPLFTPQRWDVVVFKTPTPPGQGENVSTGAGQAFIKRLVGLPGEEVAIVDGDIFTRPNDGAPAPTGKTRWDLPDWKIAVKHERAQRAVWQPIFDSSYAVARDSGGRPFQGPFLAGGPGWDIAGKTAYVYAGSSPGTLVWDASADDAINYDGLFQVNAQAVREQVQKRWTLTDAYAMDDVRVATVDGRAAAHGQVGQMFFYPVSDLRLGAGVQPAADGETFSVVIATRGHEFRGRIGPKGPNYEAVLEMRPQGQAADRPWTPLATSAVSPLTKGVVTNVELWHADQQLRLWIDDRPVLTASYPWSIAERVRNTLGLATTDLASANPRDGVDYARSMLLRSGKNYCKPRPSFEISGPATLHRVRIDRDLYYQPIAGPKLFAGGAHPSEEFAKKLSPDQYFVCGDNSPMSSDARAWVDVDKWVSADIDPTPGVVNRRLFVGKAFFVYFPAVQTRQVFGAKVPMVDAGRARWIW